MPMDAIFTPLLLLKIAVFLIEISTKCKSEISLGSEKYFRIVKSNGELLPPEKIISSHVVHSQVDCSLKCLNEATCVGFNYRPHPSNKYTINCQISNKTQDGNSKGAGGSSDWTFYQDLETLLLKNGTTVDDTFNQKLEYSDNITSCKDLYNKMPNLTNGYYELKTLEAYCDLSNYGWTLIARFSNSDIKHWIGNGSFWYDQKTLYGEVSDPSHTLDMISPAFWKVKGDEFKITRSDDSNHKALLQTTSRCLEGVPFRSKITSYGNFTNGQVWASDKCQGRCKVIYDGQYSTTAGFEKHGCSSNLQSSNYIGFWCSWKYDGALMMIGGGGDDCGRADHGIGITEENKAIFGGEEDQHDFGSIDNYISIAPAVYSLNLWVR